MKLTLAEAATVLGKSPRQVRYMIRQDRLAGREVAGGTYGATAMRNPISTIRTLAKYRLRNE